MELPSLAHTRAAAAVVGDKLVLVGGQNEKKLVPQTEVFDGKSWTDAADLPTPREHLAPVSDGFYVYTVGGRFLSTDKNSAAFERSTRNPGNGSSWWTCRLRAAAMVPRSSMAGSWSSVARNRPSHEGGISTVEALDFS